MGVGGAVTVNVDVQDVVVPLHVDSKVTVFDPPHAGGGPVLLFVTGTAVFVAHLAPAIHVLKAEFTATSDWHAATMVSHGQKLPLVLNNTCVTAF